MVLEGATNIRDLESDYHIRVPRDEGFETLAGFVLSKLQRIPADGDNFEFEGRRYTVVDWTACASVAVKIEETAIPAHARSSATTSGIGGVL